MLQTDRRAGAVDVEYLVAASTAFALIAPVELPDKTFVATLVLATRFRAVAGVDRRGDRVRACRSAIAVAAGGLLSLLPETPVQLVAAGAVRDRRGRRCCAGHAAPTRPNASRSGSSRRRSTAARTGWRAIGHQLPRCSSQPSGATCRSCSPLGWSPRGEPPVAVFIGAWAALAVVSGAAVLLGRWLLRRIRLAVVRYLAAGVCAILSSTHRHHAFSRDRGRRYQDRKNQVL